MSTHDLDHGGVIKKVYEPNVGTDGALAVDIVGQSIGPIQVVSGALSVLGTYNVDYTHIQASGGSPYQISSGFLTSVKQIILYEVTGTRLQLLTGASPALLLLIGPGQDDVVNVAIPASTAISIRSDETAPTGGSLVISFLG